MPNVAVRIGDVGGFSRSVLRDRSGTGKKRRLPNPSRNRSLGFTGGEGGRDHRRREQLKPAPTGLAIPASLPGVPYLSATTDTVVTSVAKMGRTYSRSRPLMPEVFGI